MIKKRLLAGVAAVIMTAGMCSCGGSDSSEPASTNDTAQNDSSSSQVEENSSDDSKDESGDENEPQQLSYEEHYEVMKEKSLCSLGYVNKMKDVLLKAESGEEVTIAYIGGSITEGYTVNKTKCYAFLTYKYFVDTYGSTEMCNYVNAGLSGTPSILGAFRLERDVLNYDPDIVFIEFAVNDGTDFNYQTAYEGLIRSIYEKNPDAAIVLLFSRTEDGYTAQDNMKKIGEYYDLPMISYADGISYMFDNEQLTWKDFSNDQSHPNVDGHVIVSDMIEYYYNQVTLAGRSEEEYAYPEEPMLGETYVDCHILEGDELTPESAGSWTEGSNINTFTNGWTFSGDKDNNEPAVFKVSGKTLYLLFKENAVDSGMGTVKVTVTAPDGTSEDVLINAETSGGWGDPTVGLIKEGDEEQEYTVSISMEEGFEDREFQILGFGYNNK